MFLCVVEIDVPKSVEDGGSKTICTYWKIILLKKVILLQKPEIMDFLTGEKRKMGREEVFPPPFPSNTQTHNIFVFILGKFGASITPV